MIELHENYSYIKRNYKSPTLEFSFLFATNKPIVDTFVYDNIKYLSYELCALYEVLVYSSCEKYDELKNTKFVHPLEDCGSVFGYNYLYSLSKGKYIICLSDYALIPNNIDKLINFLKLQEFEACTFSACNHYGDRLPAGDKSHCRLTDCDKIQSLIKLNDNDLNEKTLFDIPILFFPIIKKDIIEKHLNGMIYNPYFRHRWIDNWLSLFLVRKGCINLFELKDFVCHTGNCPSCIFYAKSRTRNGSEDEYDEKILEWLFKHGDNYLDKPKFDE